MREKEIQGKRILEVGSYSVNGSIRPLVESYRPQEYLGVDIVSGPGVDMVCPVQELESRLGKQSFDVVISTEMLEHVQDWKAAIHNIKGICREQGTILLTTRSYGFVYHAYPYDFWRYEVDDMKYIFQDCHIERLEKDPEQNGVFLKCRKPQNFVEQDLTGHDLYSILAGKRMNEFTDEQLKGFRPKFLKQKARANRYVHRLADKLFPLV